MSSTRFLAMIEENIARIKERIGAACSTRGVTPEEITLVAVTKGRSLAEIREAVGAGIRDIGENRVQEALSKYGALHSLCIRWHMIGHLQANKAKDAVRIFDLIHSVDSLRVAYEIDRQSALIGKRQDILLEVKTSLEKTKFGFSAQEAVHAAQEIAGFTHLKLKGLMTVAPITVTPEEARPYFQELRKLKDSINQAGHLQLGILSMGMSSDFEIAIEEGANMIRVGSAVFAG